MNPSRIKQFPTIRNPNMSFSSLITNPKKNGKSKHAPHNHVDQNHAKWKTLAQHQLYSSKLHEALTRVKVDMPHREKVVFDTAERLLADVAKGRTRWSRAILTKRLKLKFRMAQLKRYKVVGPVRPKKPKLDILCLKKKSVPAVQEKVRVLGRLIPGCKKEPLPVILDEAKDYIPALQMQVRAMLTLAYFHLGSSSVAASTFAPPN